MVDSASRPWKIGDKVYAARVSWYDSKVIIGVATVMHLGKVQATIDPDNGESSGAFAYHSRVLISELSPTKAVALAKLGDELTKKLEASIEEQKITSMLLMDVAALVAQESP